MNELLIIEESIKNLSMRNWGHVGRKNRKLKKTITKNISEYSEKLKNYILHNGHDNDKSPENLSFKLMGLEFSNAQLIEVVSVIDKWDLWSIVCKHQRNLSGKFIIEHIDKMNIENILKYQNLSEKVLNNLIILKKIKKKSIWNILWTYYTLSGEFMQRHMGNINWKIIIKGHVLSEEFIVQNKEHFAKYIWILFKHQKIPANMIDYFINLQNTKGIRFKERTMFVNIAIFEKQVLCRLIMRYQNPSYNIIKRYGISRYIVSDTIKYNKLDENIIEDIFARWVCNTKFKIRNCKRSIILKYVCKYQYLSEEFIERYEKILDWKLISQYQKLTFDLLLRYPDRINWCGVFKNKYMNKLPYLEDIKNKYFLDLKKILNCYEELDIPGDFVRIIRMYQY